MNQSSHQKASGPPAPSVIEQIFVAKYAIKRHCDAPALREREAYLQQLILEGRSRKTLVDTASMLNHVVRLVTLGTSEQVSPDAVKAAGLFWVREHVADRKQEGKKSALQFNTVANGFLRFHGLLASADPMACSFDHLSHLFRTNLEGLGYMPTTVADVLRPTRRFLFWLSLQCETLSSVSYRHVETYLKEGRSRGWRPRTIVCQCHALRTFFNFSESKGWCKPGISQTIVNPIVRTGDWTVAGPTWKEVRRMIDGIGSSTAADCRAKPILLLCSLYGLRRTEIAQLRLENFDWQAETFSVKRAKRGRWQTFPIHPELGNAIIQYLKQVRPNVACRSLFVTLSAPYRPIANLTPIVIRQMGKAGIRVRPGGPHALRHACATELLRNGTPLHKIADFLGHRDIRSVSIYAQHDLRSLDRIAKFSLSEVL